MGFTERISNIALNFDLVGSKIELYHKGSTKSQTIIGSLISTSILIFFLYCIIYFGLDIIYKEQPISRFSKEYVNVSRINLKDYPVKILFSQPPGIAIADVSRFMTFRTMYMKIGINDGGVVFDSLIVEHCKDEFVGDKKEFFNYQGDYYFSNAYCINPFKYIAANGTTVNEDVFFQNAHGAGSSASLILDLWPCVNSTANDNTCYSTEEQNRIVAGLTLNIIHMDSYINLNDHDKPYSYFTNALLTWMTFTTKKAHYLSVLKAVITTDEGFIMEDRTNSTHYQVESIRADTIDEPFYYRFVLASSNLQDNYFRSYTKVQDIIAKIGGLFQFLLSIATYLISTMSVKSMRFEVINSLYRCNDEIVEENTRKNFLSGMSIINNQTIKVNKPPRELRASIYDYYKSLLQFRSKYSKSSYKMLLSNIESRFEVGRIIEDSVNVEYLTKVLLSMQQLTALRQKPVVNLITGEIVYEMNDDDPAKRFEGQMKVEGVNLIKLNRNNNS
jgi:hypothetical protein